jgi:hypothetical protein
MKSFLSYSVKEQFEMLVIQDRVGNQGFWNGTNIHWDENGLDDFVKRDIKLSTLFVGYITSKRKIEQVLTEWHYAQSIGIPNLLLIEDTIKLPEPVTGNVIVFNREKPQKAINEIKKRMIMTLPSTTIKREDIIAWTFGGEALMEILNWYIIRPKEELVAA